MSRWLYKPGWLVLEKILPVATSERCCCRILWMWYIAFHLPQQSQTHLHHPFPRPFHLHTAHVRSVKTPRTINQQNLWRFVYAWSFCMTHIICAELFTAASVDYETYPVHGDALGRASSDTLSYERCLLFSSFHEKHDSVCTTALIAIYFSKSVKHR